MTVRDVVVSSRTGRRCAPTAMQLWWTALPRKHLPPEPKPSARSRQDPLVLVATAQSEPLAAMWAGILEDEGIRSVVESRDLRAAMYVLVPAFPLGRIFMFWLRSQKG